MSPWEKIANGVKYLSENMLLHYSPELGHHSSIYLQQLLLAEQDVSAANINISGSLDCDFKYGPAQIFTDIKGG